VRESEMVRWGDSERENSNSNSNANSRKSDILNFIGQ
jgi:hypothetical protein